MKIIFVGGIFPEVKMKEMIGKSKGLIQIAADTFQKNLIKGFDSIDDKLVKIINFPFLGNYPNSYKDLYIKRFLFSHIEGATDVSAGFLTIKGIDFLHKYIQCYRELSKWNSIKSDTESNIILVYGIFPFLLNPALKLKAKNPSIKVCLVVPDLPSMMGGGKSLKYTIFNMFNGFLLKNSIKEVDAFVLLSSYMANYLQVGSRPWILLEGIYNDKIAFPPKIHKENNVKTILYTGTLARRYGILNLLEAFNLIKNDNYRLWICGSGDAEVDIIKRMKSDNRISFFGQVPRDEIANLQRQATVLVNPRTAESEFTKYSFPSKLMEYLASGTPCIIHRLDGIPTEYYDYCYVAEEDTVVSLYSKMIDICETNADELEEFGRRAQKFILNNKTPEIQCKKIFNMLLNL